MGLDSTQTLTPTLIEIRALWGQTPHRPPTEIEALLGRALHAPNERISAPKSSQFELTKGWEGKMKHWGRKGTYPRSEAEPEIEPKSPDAQPPLLQSLAPTPLPELKSVWLVVGAVISPHWWGGDCVSLSDPPLIRWGVCPQAEPLPLPAHFLSF